MGRGGALTEGAHLRDAACAAQPRQRVQELALGRRHADGGEAAFVARPESGVEGVVGGQQQTAQVLVDVGPQLLGHGA